MARLGRHAKTDRRKFTELEMLPIEYAIRNLFRDPKRLFQAILGSALVVFMVMVATALNHGMDGVLSASGSPNNAPPVEA